jgi:DNA-binding transcriptional LysR family regulator
VSQARDLDFALREVVSGQTGVLRIGAITASMLDLVPRLMDRLTARHPMLSIRLREIDSVEALPALDNGDIDIAFVRLEGRVGSDIATLPLSEDRLAVALSATHPLAGRSYLSLNDISEERFVFSARSVSPVYFDALLSACRGHGFAPRIHSEVRSIASQIAFVACNQGVALVPTAMAPLAPRGVVFLPLKEALSVVTLAVAWKTEHQNPMARDAIFILENMIQASDIGG